MNTTDKKYITKEQIEQLEKLREFAVEAMKTLDEIYTLAQTVTGEPEMGDYTCEYLDGTRTIEELLEKLEVEILK